MEPWQQEPWIVHEVNSFGRQSESKKRACALPARIDCFDHLRTCGSDLNQISIATIGRKHVSVGRDCQTERSIKRSPFGYRHSSSSAGKSRHCFRNGGNAVRERVGNVERSSVIQNKNSYWCRPSIRRMIRSGH
jgi:hypothetical protein